MTRRFPRPPSIQDRPTAVRRILFALAVVGMANLGALIDWVMHPEIPYLDEEHLLVGGITALAMIILFGALEAHLTRRRRTEEASRANEKSLEEAQRLAHIGSWQWTAATDAVHWSAGLCDILGHDPNVPPPGFAEMSSYYTPESWKVLAEAVATAMATGEPYELDLDVVRTDGMLRATHARGLADRDSGGAVVGLHGTVQDITERRRAEEEIRRMAQALDSAPAAVTVYDFGGRYLFANQRALELHGHDRDTFMALTVGQLSAPADAALFAPRMRELREHGRASFEATHLRRDGTTLPLDVSITGTTWDGRDAVLSIATDITERRQAEAEMTRLRQAVAASSEAIFMTNREGVLTFVNPAFTNLYGFAAEDVIGRITPRALKSGAMSKEAYEAFWRALLSGQEVKGELVNRTKDGRLLNIEGSSNAILDETGQIVGFLAIQRDITARKAAEAEIRRLNVGLEARVRERTAELAAANRELESFSYSISHDLKAPLRAINGFGSILGRRYRDALDEKGRHYLDTIVASSEEMGILIEELLDYSRLGREPVRAEPVPLASLVTQLRATFGERIEVAGARLEVVEPLAVPEGDPTLVARILANLVENALTYARPGVSPVVTLSANRAGRRVILAVADNGIGIPEQYQEKIFEVFSRLHAEAEYPGTGIGLSIARKAARLMGSDVTVASVEGEGSTFRFELAAAPGRGAGAASS